MLFLIKTTQKYFIKRTILAFLFLEIDTIFLKLGLVPLLLSNLCYKSISKIIKYKYKGMETIFNSYSFPFLFSLKGVKNES